LDKTVSFGLVYLTASNPSRVPTFRNISPDRSAPKETVMNYHASNYQRYEQLKREWVDSHPDATPEEYEKAMFAIAKKAGI